jgi:hypothetical protein
MFQILEFLFYFILEGKLIVLILYLIHDLYLETLFLFFFAMWLILMDKGCTVFAVLFGLFMSSSRVFARDYRSPYLVHIGWLSLMLNPVKLPDKMLYVCVILIELD